MPTVDANTMLGWVDVPLSLRQRHLRGLSRAAARVYCQTDTIHVKPQNDSVIRVGAWFALMSDSISAARYSNPKEVGWILWRTVCATGGHKARPYHYSCSNGLGLL